MQGVVDIISNRQKSVEDELLYSDQESGEGLAWDDEEPFVTPVEKARVSEKAVVQDDRGIPAPEKEMRRDAIVDNTDGEELSREIEDAGVDMNIEKAPRWFILDERVAEEPVLYDSNEKDSGQEEGNGESLGDLAMPDCLTFRTRKTEPEKGNICYMPHRLIAVWSPDGWAKSYTALNLAALAANKGFDTALINFDLLCPELDIWFGVRQTGIGEFEGNSAGVMTFGDGYETKKMSSFLKKRSWGIQYLPAGNKLGNICAPDFEMDAMEHALKIIYQRNTGSKPAITVVDAGRSYESVPTMAALRQAAIVLVPTDGSPVIAEIAKQQIEGLRRLGNSSRFIEVLFTTPGRKVTHICHERCSVMFDWNDYLIDRAAMKPACLRVDGRRAWDGVLNRLAPTGSGNVSRRM
jgi:MinD-like ATPase involved in chromosome partitioning or flagellar assembly